MLFTGYAVTDTRRLKDFAAAYDRMHRWGKIKAGGETLYVGTDNYSFPIPLDRDKAGRWYFDTAAGKDEVLARRIGSNELAAIGATGAIADAEQQYFKQPRGDSTVRQYARRFVSDPDTQNGLYWPARGGELRARSGDSPTWRRPQGTVMRATSRSRSTAISSASSRNRETRPKGERGITSLTDG